MICGSVVLPQSIQSIYELESVVNIAKLYYNITIRFQYNNITAIVDALFPKRAAFYIEDLVSFSRWVTGDLHSLRVDYEEVPRDVSGGKDLCIVSLSRDEP